MCLVLNQSLYCSHSSVCHIQLINLNNNNLLHHPLDLYSRDLRSTIILFSRNVSSNKTDWILTESRVVFTHDWLNTNWITECVLCLAFYITRASSVMNALVWGCLREISINVYYVFCFRSSLQSCCCFFICLSAIFLLHFVVDSLFLCPFILVYSLIM